MHESPFICPLFNITPKQQAAPTTESPAVDDTNDDTTSSGGMAFGESDIKISSFDYLTRGFNSQAMFSSYPL